MPPFFIAGPTAVGKTAVALALAEARGGEIVGMDAFQIYTGLDTLTAKPTPQEQARVPHHLVGIVPLTQKLNVARYVELAQAAIADIQSRGKRPIVVGGTGLYLRALTRGLAELPPVPPELRAELAATPLPELLARLNTLDPAAAKSIDTRNPRRVQRAVEICLTTGRPFSSFRQEWERETTFCGVLLERDREELYARINARAATLFEEAALEEVRAAQAAGIGPTARQVIGWNEITAFLRGETPRETAITSVQQTTRHYAKRQITWFRREPCLTPVSLSQPGSLEEVLLRAK